MRYKLGWERGLLHKAWWLTEMIMVWSVVNILKNLSSPICTITGNQRQVRKSWFHRAYWILYTIATVYSFIITICYWTVVHNPGTKYKLCQNTSNRFYPHALSIQFNYRNKQNRCSKSNGACVQFNNYVNWPYNCWSSDKAQSCDVDDGNWFGLFNIHSNLLFVRWHYKVKKIFWENW